MSTLLIYLNYRNNIVVYISSKVILNSLSIHITRYCNYMKGKITVRQIINEHMKRKTLSFSTEKNK